MTFPTPSQLEVRHLRGALRDIGSLAEGAVRERIILELAASSKRLPSRGKHQRKVVAAPVTTYWRHLPRRWWHRNPLRQLLVEQVPDGEPYDFEVTR